MIRLKTSLLITNNLNNVMIVFTFYYWLRFGNTVIKNQHYKYSISIIIILIEIPAANRGSKSIFDYKSSYRTKILYTYIYSIFYGCPVWTTSTCVCIWRRTKKLNWRKRIDTHGKNKAKRQNNDFKIIKKKKTNNS